MSKQPLFHFEISERKVLLRLFDSISVIVTLGLVGIIFQFDYFQITSDYWNWSLALLLYLNLFTTVFELYDLQIASKFDLVLKNALLASSLTVLFFMLTPYFTPSLPDNRLQIIFFFFAIISPLLLWRYTYIALISSPRFYKRVLVVGDSFDINLIATSLQKSDPNYVVVGYINTDDKVKTSIKQKDLIQLNVDELEDAIEDHHISEIVVTSAYQKGLMLPLYNHLSELLKSGFPIRDYIQVYEEVTRRVPVQHVDKDFYKYFPFSRSNQNKFYVLSFRVLDILVSILGIIFGLLILPFVLIGNLAANRGELFYRQERVGKNGKIFNIYKFRTMDKNAESNGPRYAEKNDARITRFGMFLRRTRIDEIPQFYNVLKGDMSLIGPRPERPVFVKELSEKIPFYDIRHIIKPGLTGWAQVMANYGTSHTDSLEKLQYDLYYIKHRGLFLDMNVLLKTLSTIVFFRGQ
ncbi:exopolysaccharide biosynthesis polyprenyl glycosylphosphotransferase [Salegentibacter chungangensis]|uniref:Exopolysaccharide biosynthesis polyprenyl glycosylphosphotransferase n=1 Tax=Salegentibacter chungangensis TaxID=1335724 RepID=A0ABW3NQY4_9FLAO